MNMRQSPQIDPEMLADAFSDSVGKGKAKDLIVTATDEAGVGRKRRYTKEEAILIADRISDSEDVSAFVRISANTLKTRIRMGII